MKTRMYIVSMGGFDNHSSQVDATDPTIGTHATLLKRLSDAIAAFQADLKYLGVEQRVIGMTFSEFGRRVQSNASRGTDHGTAAPMFLFGAGVLGAVLGNNPSLTDLTSSNLKMQYDFRSAYASILNQWFGAGTNELNAVLLRSFQQLPIIKPGVAVSAEEVAGLPTEYRLYENFPNPFNPSTMISYDLPGEAEVTLKVFDMLGREITTLINERQNAGHHAVQFSATPGLASGAYIYSMNAGSFSARKRMLFVK